MGVQIPVSFDVLDGIQDAIKNQLPKAMADMQKAVDEEALEVVVEINKKGDLAEVIDFVGKTKMSMDELKYAIKSVNKQIDEMYAKTGSIDFSQGEAKHLLDAKLVLEDTLKLRKGVTGAIDNAKRAVEAETEAERQHQAALQASLNTVAGLSARLKALNEDMANEDVLSPTWQQLAKDVYQVSKRLERANLLAKEFGAETGSIDRLNAKMQRLTASFNALSNAERYNVDGTMSSKARAIVDAAKETSNALRKEAASLDSIIQKEQKRAENIRKATLNRQYENTILNTTVRTLDILTAKEQILSKRMSKAEIGSTKYSQIKKDLESVRAELDIVNGRVKESTIPALDKAGSSLERLVKRSLYLVGLHTATSFIRNIREVTSEFEMQRVALGGIIQDTEKANSLFKQIKAAAVESPFEIKDLVTYTKQLSAYRVETEDLFRITMQLADVSAGLGVDMNRLILAYGQVKAAAVLRGQELRQFTEAGIPLVKLLADKFEELGRAGTTTADVFELISKRAVPFEMIAEIFDDMTQRGGMFYKMQEKQAETLLGQWNNLKDALSIMYDEIGNTDTVHNAMTTLINDARFVFQNWRLISGAVKAAAVQFAALKVASLWLPNLKRELTLAKKAQDAFNRSQELGKYAAESGSKAALRASARLKTYSALMKQASLETRLFHRTWLQLRAVMSGGGWIGLAIGAVTALASVLYSAWQESKRLEKELEKIGAEGSTSINRSISNFKRLADAAVSATDGSKEQIEAVAELKRTYGDIIPVQQLEANALRELEGNYTSLTRAIREKISEQIREQKVSAIVDEYGKKITKKQRGVKDYLSAYGLDKEQIGAVMDAIQQAVEDGMIGISSTMYERRVLFKNTVKDLTGVVVDFGNGFRDLTGTWRDVRDMNRAENALNGLLDVFIDMNGAVSNVNESMKEDIGTYGKFAQMSRDLQKDIEGIQIDTSKFGKRGTFSYNQEDIRQRVSKYWDYIQKAFDEVNSERSEKIDIADALLGDGKINFDFLSNAVDEAMAGGQNTHLDAFIESIQEGYERLVPSDRIINLVRSKVMEFAKSFDVPMNTAQQYFKKADDSMEDYVKGLQEAEKALTSSVNQMNLNNAEIEKGNSVLKAYTEDEIKATDSTLSLVQALIKFFEQFKKNTKTGKTPYQQDPFIRLMQERIKFMKDFQKGYEDLNKYMDSGAALHRESGIMRSRGLSLGISEEDQRRAAKDLAGWYKSEMERIYADIQKKYGLSETLEQFLSQEIKDTSNRGKALRDWQGLLQSIFNNQTDLETTEAKKSLEKAIKKLKDELKRSEAAKNFYNDILGLTGDQELAANMAVSIYGDPGKELGDRIRQSIADALNAPVGEGPSVTAAQRSAIENAAKNLDFREVLKEVDQYPDHVRDAVKEAADIVEKYNMDIAKSFAELVSKYGSTQQKIDTITAKATNEIKKVKEARDKALKEPGVTPEQSKKINDRADEVIKALEAQRDLDIFKAGDDYIKFFAELNVMTADQAALVRTKLRDAYLKAFHDGAISADELSKNLRAIDTQFRKLTQSSSLLESYLDGGFDKANEKLQEYADNVSVLAQKMKSGKELSADEQNFATKMLSQFGSGSTANIESYQQLIEAFSGEGGGLEAAGEAFGQMGEGMSAMAANGPGALAIVDAIFKAVHATISGIQQIIDQLNEVRSEENKIGDWFKYISDFDRYTFSGWEKLKSGDAIGATVDAISSWISIFTNAQKDKVKKFNDQIKEQGTLLEDLEYEYSRLSVAIEKSFGSDYISNYNKQLDVLQAKAEAYRNQAELERKKGKSADEDTAKGYEKSARDVEAQIADMQSQLSEFFTGTDLTSAAKDFAEAWIEAYKEFGSTTDAMSEKFNDMIENMVVNSLAAALIQDILDPVFRAISEAAKDGELSAQDIASISALVPDAMAQIDAGMTGLMSQLTAAGVNLRQQAGSFTGISRDIASASEESITGLAAGINTQNFYMQHIDQNVALILSALTGGTTTGQASVTGQVADPYKDEMLKKVSCLPTIDENLAALLTEVRRVIKPRNARPDYVLHTNL